MIDAMYRTIKFSCPTFLGMRCRVNFGYFLYSGLRREGMMWIGLRDLMPR